MSPKELLYIDDALGHEQFLIAQCQEAEAALSDRSSNSAFASFKAPTSSSSTA